MCFMGKRWHMDVYGMASHHPSHNRYNRNPYNYVYLDPYENGLMNMTVFSWQYGIATIDRCPCLTMFKQIKKIKTYVLCMLVCWRVTSHKDVLLFIGPVLAKISISETNLFLGETWG